MQRPGRPILHEMRAFLYTSLGLAALVLFERLGAMVAAWTGGLLPGSVVGFVLLALATCVFRQVPQGLQRPSAWLLNHLPLFLMPALFSAVLHFSVDASLWAFLALCSVAGTLVPALVSAFALWWWNRRCVDRLDD